MVPDYIQPAGHTQSPGYSTHARGQFAGVPVRCELVEVQGPVVGVKFVSKGRRAIDPPPVLRFRAFQRVPGPSEGEDREEELTCVPVGLICHADLYKKASEDPGQLVDGDAPEASPSTEPSLVAEGTPAIGSPMEDGTPVPEAAPIVDSADEPAVTGPRVLETAPASAEAGETLVNELLFGLTVTHGMTMSLDGSHGLVFAFTDLSVRAAGAYFLRYRCFDIFTSGDDPAAHPLLARATGAPFRIYSAKDFPGFAPSTKLTRTLAIMGASVRNRSGKRSQGGGGGDDEGEEDEEE